eukprot:CFRG5218T1
MTHKLDAVVTPCKRYEYGVSLSHWTSNANITPPFERNEPDVVWSSGSEKKIYRGRQIKNDEVGYSTPSTALNDLVRQLGGQRLANGQINSDNISPPQLIDRWMNSPEFECPDSSNSIVGVQGTVIKRKRPTESPVLASSKNYRSALEPIRKLIMSQIQNEGTPQNMSKPTAKSNRALTIRASTGKNLGMIHKSPSGNACITGKENWFLGNRGMTPDSHHSGKCESNSKQIEESNSIPSPRVIDRYEQFSELPLSQSHMHETDVQPPALPNAVSGVCIDADEAHSAILPQRLNFKGGIPAKHTDCFSKSQSFSRITNTKDPIHPIVNRDYTPRSAHTTNELNCGRVHLLDSSQELSQIEMPVVGVSQSDMPGRHAHLHRTQNPPKGDPQVQSNSQSNSLSQSLPNSFDSNRKELEVFSQHHHKVNHQDTQLSDMALKATLKLKREWALKRRVATVNVNPDLDNSTTKIGANRSTHIFYSSPRASMQSQSRALGNESNSSSQFLESVNTTGAKSSRSCNSTSYSQLQHRSQSCSLHSCPPLPQSHLSARSVPTLRQPSGLSQVSHCSSQPTPNTALKIALKQKRAAALRRRKASEKLKKTHPLSQQPQLHTSQPRQESNSG